MQLTQQYKINSTWVAGFQYEVSPYLSSVEQRFLLGPPQNSDDTVELTFFFTI
jgi:hypothetical protein